MFMTRDVKAHAPRPALKRPREACLPVVNDFLLAISCTVPQPRQAPARAAHSQHCFRDPTKAEIRRFFAKKGSGAYPSAVARTDRATGNLSGRLDSNNSGPAQGPAGAFTATQACGKLAQRVPEGSPCTTGQGANLSGWSAARPPSGR